MYRIKFNKYNIINIIFIIIIGSLFHFTYKLSNENFLVAVFSATNESVWEHLKLIYFPMLLTIIIEFIYIGKEAFNYLCSKTIGILVAMLFIIVFFYTYTGVIGKNIAIIDIASFCIAVILGEYISYILIRNKFNCNKKIPILVLLILLCCFIVFTFNTPKIGIFRDQITKQYGINKTK